MPGPFLMAIDNYGIIKIKGVCDMQYVGKYNYEELERDALSASAAADDIARLGEWFERYGRDFWNGESYDINGRDRLFPIYQENDDGVSFSIIAWEIK